MEINIKKKRDMKKILIISILSVAMSSCYKDYIKDFDYDGIYFPYQTDDVNELSDEISFD